MHHNVTIHTTKHLLTGISSDVPDIYRAVRSCTDHDVLTLVEVPFGGEQDTVDSHVMSSLTIEVIASVDVPNNDLSTTVSTSQ